MLFKPFNIAAMFLLYFTKVSLLNGLEKTKTKQRTKKWSFSTSNLSNTDLDLTVLN